MPNEKISQQKEKAVEKLPSDEKEMLKKEIMEKYEVSDKVAEIALQHLLKREDHEIRIKEKLIDALPEVAKTNNPIIATLLDHALTGSATNDELEEFKSIIKPMIYSIVIPQMIKEITSQVGLKGGGESSDKEILLKYIEERESKIEELINELRKQRENEQISKIREEFYKALENMSAMVYNALEQMKSSLELVQANSAQVNAQPNDPLASIENIKQMINASKELLSEMGYKVMKPDELYSLSGDKMSYELKLKEKELRIKEKEIESKKVLYEAFAEGIKTLLSNPRNIIELFVGLKQALSSGPSPEEVGNAMKAAQSSMTNNVIELKDLDDFMEGDASE